MKRHAFGQEEVLSNGRTERQKDIMWSKFTALCKYFGYSIRITGGNFLTHEIDCGKKDFDALLNLYKLNV